MKPIDRPSSAGSHASVDSQDSSVSWLLSLEGERSHFGHKAIVSLCDPETTDNKGNVDESSYESEKMTKIEQLMIKTHTKTHKKIQKMDSTAQTAAERKAVKAKATEALLRKYKDSPYSRVPLPLDLRKELKEGASS